VASRSQLYFNGLHGLISQKIERFIIIAVRTSNPTQFAVCSKRLPRYHVHFSRQFALITLCSSTEWYLSRFLFSELLPPYAHGKKKVRRDRMYEEILFPMAVSRHKIMLCYWVSGPHQPSGIIKNIAFRKLGLFPSLREKGVFMGTWDFYFFVNILIACCWQNLILSAYVDVVDWRRLSMIKVSLSQWTQLGTCLPISSPQHRRRLNFPNIVFFINTKTMDTVQNLIYLKCNKTTTRRTL
jgi:hypothetical protein